MKALKLTAIRTEAQYDQYCLTLEELLDKPSKSDLDNKQIENLGLLIEKWDAEHFNPGGADPIEILKSLMTDHKMNAYDYYLAGSNFALRHFQKYNLINPEDSG